MTTALQVTDFDFYGDSLMALKDNATGEIYTAINFILRGIGFTNDDQIRKRRDKWINDSSISKGVTIFDTPHPSGGVQQTYCISIHKLPLALAKISITPKMKKEQSELSSKLELYQDKCADVLASVFIDKKDTSYNNLDPLISVVTKLIEVSTETNTRLSKLEEQQNKLLLPKKTYSRWTSKMFPKYQLLMDYLNISRSELYHNLYIELENQNPDIDLKQLQEDYCYEHGISNCFTLDAIEHNKTIRTSFEFLVDNLLDDYNLIDSSSVNTFDIRPTIFNS